MTALEEYGADEDDVDVEDDDSSEDYDDVIDDGDSDDDTAEDGEGDEETAEDEDDDEEKEDLVIQVTFYEDSMELTFDFFSSRTISELMDDIRDSLLPPGKSEKYIIPPEIKDGAMFIYQGEDLCRKDLNLTLQQVGMVEGADILIIYSGTFTEDIPPSLTKSSHLKSLAESARINGKAGIGIKKQLEIVEVPSDWKKIIYLEIPVSDGISLLMSGKVGLTYEIETVKQDIRFVILRSCPEPPGQSLQKGSSLIGDFDLLLNGEKLDPWMTLSDYGVKEFSKLQLSRKLKYIDVSLPLKIDQAILTSYKVKSLDNVSKLQVEISLVTGFPTGKQMLKYQNEVLVHGKYLEEKSLVDLGVRFCFHDSFIWAPKANVLEVLPSTPVARSIAISPVATSIVSTPASTSIVTTASTCIGEFPWSVTGYYDQYYEGYSRPLKFRRTL